jgi:hypothetical protein
MMGSSIHAFVFEYAPQLKRDDFQLELVQDQRSLDYRPFSLSLGGH